MAKELKSPKAIKMIAGYRFKDSADTKVSYPFLSREELQARSETVTEVLQHILRFPLRQPK